MTVAYPLDAHSFGFIEKSQTVYDFGLETNRHPPGIHLFGDKWFINRFFIKQTETRVNFLLYFFVCHNFNSPLPVLRRFYFSP